MPSNEKADELRLGFLSAVEVANRGYVGGLLVTNRFGRPLEFQCTSPVQPNRMQEILYGPTLVPYILTELIGTTLLDKVSIKPHLVLTEQEALLELRNHVSIPVVLVKNESAAAGTETAQAESAPPAAEGAAAAAGSAPAEAEGAAAGTESAPATAEGTAATAESAPPAAEGAAAEVNASVDEANVVEPCAEPPREMRLGRQFLRFHTSHASDRDVVAAGAASVPPEADLCEPFGRVREALEETTRAAGAR